MSSYIVSVADALRRSLFGASASTSRPGPQASTVRPSWCCDRNHTSPAELLAGDVGLVALADSAGVEPERLGDRNGRVGDALAVEVQRAPVAAPLVGDGESQLLHEAAPALVDVVVPRVPVHRVVVRRRRPRHLDDRLRTIVQQREHVPTDVQRVCLLVGDAVLQEDELDLVVEPAALVHLPAVPPPDQSGVAQGGPDLADRSGQGDADRFVHGASSSGRGDGWPPATSR